MRDTLPSATMLFVIFMLLAKFALFIKSEFSFYFLLLQWDMILRQETMQNSVTSDLIPSFKCITVRIFKIYFRFKFILEKQYLLKVNKHSFTHESSPLLRESIFNYRVHSSSWLILILSHIGPIHISKPPYLNTSFILPPTPGFHKGSFIIQLLVTQFCTCCIPRQLHPPEFE